MTMISNLESNVLIALTMEAFKDSSSPPDVFEVAERYRLNCDATVLQSVITELEEDGMIRVLRNGNKAVAAGLKSNFLIRALPKVLKHLNATEFRVNWPKEEIMTDADPSIDFPSLEGWKVFYFDTEPKVIPNTQSSVVQPIHITNTFSPVNNVSAVGTTGEAKRDNSGWWNLAAALIVGALAILATLWVGGKI